MIRTVIVLLFLASLVVASRVLLPIEKVEVVGNKHLSQSQIRKATGLVEGGPWLWAWPNALDALRKNPWVKSADLQRSEIGQVKIVLQERTPIASFRRDETLLGLASDGVFLPDAPRQTTLIEGKGTVPLSSLITLAQAFPQAFRIGFDSSGYRVSGENFNLWATTVRELQDWSKIRRIVQSDALPATNPNAQTVSSALPPTAAKVSSVYVYSWGVSVRR